MRTRIFLFFSTTILIFSSYYNLYSQSDSLTIKLLTLPPNTLTSSTIWRLKLTNKTNTPVSISLEGYVDEATQGRIVEGNSNTFTLNPGASNYNYSNFSSGSVTWQNTKYRDYILKSGSVPAGVYTICVIAHSSDGLFADKRDCITTVINRPFETEIMLISPSDGDSVSTSSPFSFSWSGSNSSVNNSYTLKIVEVLNNQSPEQLIKQDNSFFRKNNITINNFLYTQSFAKLTQGKKYAWKVSTDNNESNIGIFFTKQEGSNIETVLNDVYKLNEIKKINLTNSKELNIIKEGNDLSKIYDQLNLTDSKEYEYSKETNMRAYSIPFLSDNSKKLFVRLFTKSEVIVSGIGVIDYDINDAGTGTISFFSLNNDLKFKLMLSNGIIDTDTSNVPAQEEVPFTDCFIREWNVIPVSILNQVTYKEDIAVSIAISCALIFH